MSLFEAKKRLFVRRITVDERLAEDLIRLFISLLKERGGNFSDCTGDWEDEQQVMIRPQDYFRKMGMTKAQAQRYPFESFVEGQVFLVGAFEPSEQRGKFRTTLGKRRVECVDESAKKEIKELYFKVLQGRRRGR